MGGVTVAPFKGTKSLRLGACRAINQSQPKGTNTASQTFTPVSSPLRVAFRLFSWEHRGSDQLLIELKKGNQAVGTLQSPVSLPMGGVPGGQRTCSGALPCSFTIDTGNSGNFVATNWTTMAIDVPQSAIGQSLTLSYSVIGGKDNGFPTWAYFDNVNTPPVARFDHQTVNVREGDRVQFTDTSFDPDGDAIVDWRWEINGEVLSDQNPVFIFADEGTYSACLTVTDSFGDTNRVCTGGTATDGTPISTLTLVNQPPRVNALNVETLAGQPVGLFGRTLESGWGDTLSANWQVNGQSPTATITNDMMPLLATAIINGQVTTSTTVPGTLTVSDQDGGTGSDPFQVRVVPNDPQRFEPNNSLGNVPVLTSDSSYLSWIQTVGDQDFFEVNLPDASHPLLPAGGEVLVTLKGPGGAGLNADYDLVILAQSPGGVGGFQSGDAGQTNINTFGFQSGGFQSGGFQSGGFHSGGFQSGSIRPGGFQSGGFQSGGFQSGSALYPLSQIGFNGLEGDDVGAADISLDELGLGNLQGSVTVAAYSGNHGTRPEAALARSAVPGTRFFIGVLGANAAFSGSEPYTLQVETSVPLDLAEVLGPEVCNRSPLVGPNSSNPPTTTAVDLNPGLPANAPTTLIVTQRERMIALYDNPATTTNEGLDRWNALLPKLQAVAQHPAVHADLISLPSVLYDNADRNPCDVDETNSLAAAIRGQIQARLGLNQSIQYVVIAGDDDVVPQRRVPDETIIGNESNYLADALVNPGSPLFASLLGGFILTDDYYVDDVPTPWNGRELYVPDRPIARLVETPEEIGAAADAFSASNGVLDYSTAASAKALVTGYDFFTDGATATAANLASKLSTSTLINPTWTADDLRCAMLGEATGCTSPSVIAANAHYTHYLALSANGFGTHNFADTLKSNEVAAAGGTAPTLQRHVVFTMGCHGGLNVPDRAAKPADPGQALDPSLDFAQAMARQRAVFVASTGYGLGDDVGLGGTELLLTVFGKELVKGDVFIGNALRDAKESYLLSLLSMTPYDEKSSIQLTMYGLPMYQVRVPEGAGSIAPLPAQAAPSSTFSLTVRDGASTTTTTHNIEQAATANGSYFTADGDAQTTAFRAIQPRLVIPLPPGNPAQGVLIKSGTYTDTPGFNPVISRPSQDWLLSDDEPQTCLDAYWPSVPATVNRVDPGGGQTLVVTPGQFRCTSGSPPVTGIQRNYQSMTVEILHSDPADTQPPIVNEVSMSPGTGGSLDVTVKANDPSGIARIILLKYSGGVVTPIELNLSQPFPATGTFTINVPSVQPADDIAGELVDGADNIAYFTAKGAIGYTFLGVDLTPDPQFVAPGSPASFQVSVPDFAQLDEPFYTIDFGDGLFGSGPVTGTTFNVTHTYPIGTQLPTTAKIRVMDADGRLGSDSVAVRLRCDPIGDSPTSGTDYVGCDVSSTATTITIAVRVVGTIESKSQYRVNILTATKNAQMKYDNGKATSPLGSLVVTRPDASELRFTFSRADVGLASGGQLQWYAEAQHGEPGNPTVGFPDRMPDNGYRTVVIP
jgi:PKD repeat protein